MDPEELKSIACRAIDDAADDLNTLSKDLWEHPELALKEVRAHEVLTQFLEKYKFSCVEKHYHLDTAFRATYGDQSKGPHVAVMSEYDALPEIGHGCGHNLIAEVGIAVGIGIKAAMEKSKNGIGKLTVLGTPAEEAYGGKVNLIEAGALEGADIAMMAHPSKYAVLRPKYVAIKEVFIEYTGVEAHAAEWPWQGVNALDAAVLCYNNLSCLRQQMPPGWMLHGIITHGGARPNIIPGRASLEYYIRTANDKDLSTLEEKLRKCAEGAATATGCKMEIKVASHYQTLLSNDTMIKLYEENGINIGLEIERNEAIVNKIGGSTDMGNVSHTVPSIHPEFVMGSNFNSHTKEFTVASGKLEAQPYTLLTAKALAMTAIDVLTKPSLLPQIQKDFHDAIEKEKQIDETRLQ